MKTNILFKYFFGFLLSVMFALVVGMKATEEGGSGQTEEEKKAEKGMADAIAKILDKRLNGIMTEKMFTEKMEGFKIKAETIKEINDSLKAQSDIIKAFNAGSDDLPKTIMQATKAHIEGNEDLKKTLESGDSVKFKVKFTTKAAGTMTVAGSLDSSASVAPSGTTYTIDPNFIREYAQQPDIASIFQSSRIDTEVYTYTEQRAKDGSPDWKAEGATADTVDYEWVTSSSEVKEIKVKGKVSKKAMRYIPNFLMEVESLMTRDMKIKASSDFLYGDNVANTASVKGLTKHDIGFPGTTSFDGTISNPATADVITVSQAIIATRNADPVNVIVLNPVDVAHLRIERDKQPAGQASIVQVGNTLTVNGIPVVEANQITAGYILIGNSQRFNVHPSMEMDIEVGNSGDDLDKGLKTIYVSEFYHVFLKENWRGNFIYDSIADIKDQIKTVEA